MEGVAAGCRRGPVVACVDTSGSMSGGREVAAKALILAICRRVLPQGRAVHLLLFGGRGEWIELRLRRGVGGLEQVLDFLAMAFDSGTDIDTPLRRALQLVETDPAFRRADILVITDGLCRASGAVVQGVQRAREASGLRVWSVVIGRAHLGGVQPVSDQVWRIDSTRPEGALGLVRSIGSQSRR